MYLYLIFIACAVVYANTPSYLQEFGWTDGKREIDGSMERAKGSRDAGGKQKSEVKY